jgi:hypothetical protein
MLDSVLGVKLQRGVHDLSEECHLAAVNFEFEVVEHGVPRKHNQLVPHLVCQPGLIMGGVARSWVIGFRCSEEATPRTEDQRKRKQRDKQFT